MCRGFYQVIIKILQKYANHLHNKNKSAGEVIRTLELLREYILSQSPLAWIGYPCTWEIRITCPGALLPLSPGLPAWTSGASILLQTGLSGRLRVSGLLGWLGLALGLVGEFGDFR